MAVRSWARMAEALEVPRDLLLRRYPAFVTGGDLRAGEVPVFVFHSVEPRSFGRKLEHLAANGYVTLSLAEYLDVLRGACRPRAKSVLLTFDDGRGSVWSVAAPLLRRHGMKALVFLVPGRMANGAGTLGHTWDDVAAGRVEPAVVLERERRGSALLTWVEVEALARGGLFDFQSHTLTHARVHASPRLDGFVTPWSRQGYDAFDQPLVHADGRDLLGEHAPLGTPLFRSVPRMSDAPRFFEEESVRRVCVERVAEAGGAAFFESADWPGRLRAALPRKIGGRFETAAERVRAITFELAESRRLIEAHTGREVRHLCYPWHAAGRDARRLAAETGYVTAFCGKVRGARVTLPGGDPLAIARIGEDYVELLPGGGRVTLAHVLRQKWLRRFGPRDRAPGLG